MLHESVGIRDVVALVVDVLTDFGCHWEEAPRGQERVHSEVLALRDIGNDGRSRIVAQKHFLGVEVE